MIKNERQYRITKAQAEKFEQALEKLKAQPKQDDQMHPLLRRAQIDALQSQLDDLRSELREYDTWKSGNLEFTEIETLVELPRVLIRARIASGMSQKVLAERLGLKEQQIQRYEATEYASASLSTVNKIAGVIAEALKK